MWHDEHVHGQLVVGDVHVRRQIISRGREVDASGGSDDDIDVGDEDAVDLDPAKKVKCFETRTHFDLMTDQVSANPNFYAYKFVMAASRCSRRLPVNYPQSAYAGMQRPLQ